METGIYGVSTTPLDLILGDIESQIYVNQIMYGES